jgi:predicted ATPase
LCRAHSIDHPFSLAHAYRFAAAVHLSMRERDAIHDHAERSFAMSTEHGFGAVLMAANFHRGWLLARQGREEDGLALMRAWVAACREIRSECLLPGYLAWLAEMYGDIGRPQEGLDLVDEALATGTRSGNHYWTAELYRLRGALTGAEKDAESSFVGHPARLASR